MPKKTAHKPGWKIIQAQSKIKGKIQLALFVLGLIGLIILFGGALKFIRQFGQPLGLTNFGKNSWDGSSNFNFVFKGEDYSLVVLDPNEKTLKIVKLPPQVYLEVPGGYGSWQLRSIYNLGQTENKKEGPKLLKDTFAAYFNLPIDGILEISDLPNYSSKRIIEDLKNPLEAFKLLPHIKTSLNPWELIRFSLALRGVRFDKISEFDLLTLGLLGTEESKEGELQVLADPQKIDGFIRSNLIDSKLSQEGKDVAVFNATSISGLGQKGAKLISHLGLNVIQVGSLDDQTIERSLIVVKNGEAGIVIKRLQEIFGPVCKSEKDCGIISHPTISSSRGQIVVILGKDFKQ